MVLEVVHQADQQRRVPAPALHVKHIQALWFLLRRCALRDILPLESRGATAEAEPAQCARIVACCMQVVDSGGLMLIPGCVMLGKWNTPAV